jgi:hypothetical protein
MMHNNAMDTVNAKKPSPASLNPSTLIYKEMVKAMNAVQTCKKVAFQGR